MNFFLIKNKTIKRGIQENQQSPNPKPSNYKDFLVYN
jgi:hypothetical protein